MKRAIVLFFFILCASTALGQSRDTIYMQNDTVILKRDTAIRNTLLLADLGSYVGKKVEELLNNQTVKLYKKFWWSDEPPGKLYSLNLTYARGLYLRIYVRPLKYQPRFSKNRNFNLELFKKEKISKIELNRRFFEDNVVKKYAY